MNVPKLLVLVSLMSLTMISATAVTNMSPALYAQSSDVSNTSRPHFFAKLTGDNVFPPVKTNATGRAELALLGDGKTMSYNATGGPVDNVRGVTLCHSTGGRCTDIVVLRSGTQQGLSGEAKSASLVGNFTSADFLRGRGEDMPSLVRDILSGNVIVRIDTIKFPLGIVAGKLSPNLPENATGAQPQNATAPGPIPIKNATGAQPQNATAPGPIPIKNATGAQPQNATAPGPIPIKNATGAQPQNATAPGPIPIKNATGAQPQNATVPS